MTKKLTAALVASLFASAAYAVDEQSAAHDTIATAQPLEIGSGGSVTVNGKLGNEFLRDASGNPTPVVADVDFYSFQGTEGDVVTIDIDDGIKASGSAKRSVDTLVALFGPCPTTTAPKCIEVDDKSPMDAGSVSTRDARIDPFRLPRSGVYTVGVSSFPRKFTNTGGLTSTSLNATANGSYVLVISGVTPTIQYINVEIKPGSGESAPVNPKSRGNIPVALLSSAEFNAFSVDYASLTFGANGNEASLERCAREGQDIDGDGRPDLMCHFDTQKSGFEPGDSVGVIRGKTTAGRLFEGRGMIHTVGSGKRPD